MSKQSVEKYISEVMSVLKEEFPEGTIPSAYNGYISSFGASVMQSGLLPTLALFENTNACTKENKEYLTHLIARVLTGESNKVSLLHYVLGNDEALLKPKIIDIAVAIKLCIRTFKLDKGAKNE